MNSPFGAMPRMNTRSSGRLTRSGTRIARIETGEDDKEEDQNLELGAVDDMEDELEENINPARRQRTKKSSKTQERLKKSTNNSQCQPILYSTLTN